MGSTKNVLRTLFIVGILSTLIGCDRISKVVVRQRIGYNEEISLLGHYITLTRVENTGAFLSLGNDLPPTVRFLALTLFPTLILGLALGYLLTSKNLSQLSRIGICCVVGGGIGNIYDRLMYGSVTDFLHIDFVVFQTGIFNMADVSIMTGMVIILVAAYIKPRNTDEWAATQTNPQ